MIVASVGVVLGDLPSSYGVSPFLCLLASAGLLAAILRLLARPA